MEIVQYANSGGGASIEIGSAVVSGTNKSVLYINASGQIAQDNAGFNYTEASDLLTVGKILLADGSVTAPSLYWGTDMGFYRSGVTLRFARNGIERVRIGTDGRIAIGANATGEMTANGLFHATYEADANDQDGIVVVDTYGNEGYCTSIGGRTAKGTALVPLAVTTDHKLVEFMAKGHNGTTHNASNRGYIGFYAAENHSVGNEGVYSVIGTTTIATATNHNSIYISHKGDVAISKSSGGPTGVFSTGFTQGNNAKVLEVRADSTTDDGGLFIHNSNATKGLALWVDSSTSTSYIDSMEDSASSILQFRARGVNGTPTNGFSLNGAGQFLSTDGSATAPGMAFSADVDNGFHRSGNNEISWCTNGAIRFTYNVNSAQAPSGAVGTPSFSFTAATSTGMWRRAANSLGLVTNGTERLGLGATGSFIAETTITAAGTTGARTIDKMSGIVNFAAGATTLVVTNALVTTSSIVLTQVLGVDTVAKYAVVTRAGGSFTITLNAAAVAELPVAFFVIG